MTETAFQRDLREAAKAEQAKRDAGQHADPYILGYAEYLGLAKKK